jgi:nucleotide-binding universal stress UspA family protein
MTSHPEWENRVASEPPASVVARRQVVVALVGREPPLAAIEFARRVTEATGAALHGLFVSSTDVHPGDVPRLLQLPPEHFEGMVIDVEVGDPLDCLLDFVAKHPTSFVILPAEIEGPDACSLGDLATRMLEGSAANIVLVRPRAVITPLDRILVPLDGTPSTASALPPAGELARRTAATLDIVLVGEAHVRAKEPGAMSPPQYVDQPHHEWATFSDEFLQRFLSGIAHFSSEVNTRFFLGAGDPAAEILRFADALESDLLVLVWHGELGCDHASVFRTVVRGSPCPILVLRR